MKARRYYDRSQGCVSQDLGMRTELNIPKAKCDAANIQVNIIRNRSGKATYYQRTSNLVSPR